MGEIVTRRQSIDFLGFLRSQLSGLQGMPTLCYELIQNADDVKDEQGNPGASRITFDVCDDALWVENNGVFRDIDFDRMVRVSWGNKREEENTTGAFGIGFISVYQVTDSPELFSSGQHWQFRPEAQEDKRIRVQALETQFTRFRLPWAYEMSQIRQEMGIPPVGRGQLDTLTHELVTAIGAAALFLKQVRVLEVKRSGAPIRRIEVRQESDRLVLATDDEAVEWRLCNGDFKAEADGLRATYGKLIEAKRRPFIQLAIPAERVDGLLYAFLPSETRTGLPFHINGDFYPSSDRKRILLEMDYKSEWNRLAIACAAATLASNLDQVLAVFSPQEFWEFAEDVKRASDTDVISPVFATFWENIKQPIRERATTLTGSGRTLRPPETVFLQTDEQVLSAAIFEELGIATVHSDLRSHWNLLRETGARLLKLTDVAGAFRMAGLTARAELAGMPKLLRVESGWGILYSALNDLWAQATTQEKQTAATQLRTCAIGHGSDGAIWPPALLFGADAATRQLFSKFAPVVWYVEEDNPGPLLRSLVPEFGLREGLATLKAVEGSLPEARASGAFVPKEVYDWLEGHRSSIAANPQLRQAIRSLSIWPCADGSLQPLDALFLAGDFEDPLRLARLIDVEALGGRKELLERDLGVSRLDFVTYVQDWMPSALESRKLDREKHFHLLRVLAENLGKLQGQTELREILADLPLVWCGDDVFLPSEAVFFDSEDVRAVLGEETPVLQLPPEQPVAVSALYEWLGVAKSPRPHDIIARIRALVVSPPDKQKVQTVETIFGHLASHWHQWGDEIRQEFRPLQKLAWLPGSKDSTKWFPASIVYAVFREFLFESQGNFLKIDRAIQQKDRELIRFLGIEGEPSTEQVAKHLMFASENNRPVTLETYVFLAQHANDPAIRQLRHKACLYLRTPTETERYFRPDEVFWNQHPFGPYRLRLSPDFGRFKNLFDELRVKETPDASDAIAVLEDISRDYGRANIPLEEGAEVGQIVVMCWKLLSGALENNEIGAAGISRALGKVKTIPDSRRVLEPPIHLLFDDRPGWGQKFQLVKNSLVRPVEGAWVAMEAAGVRRLSNAVTVELHRNDNPRRDDSMLGHVLERIPLIRRVIEAYRSKGITGFDLEGLDKLVFSMSDRIEIVRVFSGFGRTERSALEVIDAIQIDGDLYFCPEDGASPWQSIARELSYVLHPSGEISSLGMELKEILSQSVDWANTTLDEYGYPSVEQSPEEIPTGPIAVPGAETAVPAGQPERSGEQPYVGEPVPAESPGVLGNRPPSKLRPQIRKKSRLVSYVYPPDDNENGEEREPEDPELVAHRAKVAQMGVAYVMKFETAHGRTPTDMETIQVHHPGYDIRSVDEKGQTRYIEVKSLSGTWDSQNPAHVTKTEFESPRELGGGYWLYVVEKVEEVDCRLYCIRNPSNRADYYLFDHGWQPLALQD